MQDWEAVFAAFADADGSGGVVVEGSPKNYIGDAEDLIGVSSKMQKSARCPTSKSLMSTPPSCPPASASDCASLYATIRARIAAPCGCAPEIP